MKAYLGKVKLIKILKYLRLLPLPSEPSLAYEAFNGFERISFEYGLVTLPDNQEGCYCARVTFMVYHMCGYARYVVYIPYFDPETGASKVIQEKYWNKFELDPYFRLAFFS